MVAFCIPFLPDRTKLEKCFELFLSGFWFIAATDSNQSASWGQEQSEEIEQKHHPEWRKSYCSSGCFCSNLLLCGLLLVQDVQKMRIAGPATEWPHQRPSSMEGLYAGFVVKPLGTILGLEKRDIFDLFFRTVNFRCKQWRRGCISSY